MTFKKIDFKSLNYEELNRYEPNDIRHEKNKNFYQTFDFIELVKVWPKIIGESLSSVTCPLKIKGDGLIILSKHSSYSQNIAFLSEEIKQRIFDHFPNLKSVIKKLHFQTGDSLFKNLEQADNTMKKPSIFHPQDPKYKIKKNKAEEIFSALEDEEFKKLLISIYLQSS